MFFNHHRNKILAKIFEYTVTQTENCVLGPVHMHTFTYVSKVTEFQVKFEQTSELHM